MKSRRKSFRQHRRKSIYNRSRNRTNNKAKNSGLNLEQLVRSAHSNDVIQFIPEKAFDQWDLHQKLQQNLGQMGYKYPTQIQEQTMEHLVSEKDLIGIANTGTGKTIAYLMPLVQRLLIGLPFRSLIVVPTRELALQVEQELKALTRNTGIYGASFIGGTNLMKDLKKLRRPNHVIIGTPGRLLDLTNRGALRLEKISTLVVDEFDRMLDMGFVNDIKHISRKMKARNQTMMFSATLCQQQQPEIDHLLSNPILIKVDSGNSTTILVDQDIIPVINEDDKVSMLMEMLSNHEFEKVLIFAETRRLVKKVSTRLHRNGVSVDQIHGDKTQNYRIKALDKFRRGKIQVLVATDVAARGIDVSDITHVINYQIPKNIESYIHRIGRTGRAGRKGKAYTFVDN